MHFNSKAFENSRPDGMPVLEVVGDGWQFVPLRRSELRGSVLGPLAALRLTQYFGYSTEQSSKTLEALYRFPLPGDAAVTGVQVRFGSVEIRAELRERQRAEQEYQTAKQEGRQAALLTRESPDVFTLQLAGLQPDQEIVVETSYVQMARPEDSSWVLRVPLTTSPRYVRSDELGTRHAQGQPLALLRDPGHRFSLELTVHEGATITSPTHKLSVEREGSAVKVRLADGEVLPDRDCLLRWSPRRDAQRPTLTALSYADHAQGKLYVMALVAPPAAAEQRRVAREAVLLVDHSGSMLGAKWEAADWAVKQFLSQLEDQDRFALGLFHTHTRWFERQLQPGDQRHTQKAIEFLERYRDDGGTELGVALEQALDIRRSTDERSRHVLIITDAEVSDAARILALADREASDKHRRRISLLCIDAAPNDFLAHELAERGGGVARFLTSAPEQDDITTALDEVLADWAAPILTGMTLEFNRTPVHAAGRAVKAIDGGSAIDMGDLPAGRAVWVVAQLPLEGGPLQLRLRASGQQLADVTLDPASPEADMPAIKALFGARQVLGLEYLMHSPLSKDLIADQLRRLGYDPSVLSGKPRMYAENQRQDSSAALKDLLVEEALAYGLASSETAFVATRTEAGKTIDGTVVVANALPSGWSEGFAGGGAAKLGLFYAGGPPAGAPARAFSTAMPPMAPPPAPMSRAPSFRDSMEDTVDLSLPDQEFDEVDDAPVSEAPAEPAPDGYATLEEEADQPRAQTGGLPPKPGRRTRTHFLTHKRTDGLPDAERATIASPLPAQTLYSGAPTTHDGEALLYSSDATGAPSLPEDVTFRALAIHGPAGGASIPGSLMLLLFVGDMAVPRARVRIADVLRQNGMRPLNLTRRPGEVVRLVLSDPDGLWSSTGQSLEILLRW